MVAKHCKTISLRNHSFRSFAVQCPPTNDQTHLQLEVALLEVAWPSGELEPQAGQHEAPRIHNGLVLLQVARIGRLSVDEPGQLGRWPRIPARRAVHTDHFAQLVPWSATLNLGPVRRQSCREESVGDALRIY